LQEEIKIMSQLEHKHILRLEAYEWDAVYPHKNGLTLDVVVLVLELAKGGTLVDCLVETGVFSEGRSHDFTLYPIIHARFITRLFACCILSDVLTFA
jgi:hypothetical protein